MTAFNHIGGKPSRQQPPLSPVLVVDGGPPYWWNAQEMKYPNRIKELRQARGMTLEQVAAGAGTSNQQISKLENGDRELTQSWMERVSAALRCEPWELLPPHLHPKKVNITPHEERFLAAWRKVPDERKDEEMRVLEARYGGEDKKPQDD